MTSYQDTSLTDGQQKSAQDSSRRSKDAYDRDPRKERKRKKDAYDRECKLQEAAREEMVRQSKWLQLIYLNYDRWKGILSLIMKDFDEESAKVRFVLLSDV